MVSGKSVLKNLKKVNAVLGLVPSQVEFLVQEALFSSAITDHILHTGMLQRVHPGIAVSVKTRQAIRTVLNHSRDTIRELQGAGLIDESETHKLEKVPKNQNFFSSFKPNIKSILHYILALAFSIPDRISTP